MRRTIAHAIRIVFICIAMQDVEVRASDIIQTPSIYISTVKEQMIERKPVINIKVSTELNEILMSSEYTKTYICGFNDGLGLVLEDDTEDIRGGEYLSANIWYVRSREIIRSDSYVEYEYTIKYYTTKEQEDMADLEIPKIVNQLDIRKKSEYTKVKVIHDYIIEEFAYDKTLKSNNVSSMLKEGKGTCKAYTLLGYRLLEEAGIEAKYITGMAKGSYHAWNLVKVNNKWYNLDLTWDDPVMEDGSQHSQYTYFLKSTKDFKYHKRDDIYKTKEFVKKFKIEKKSYKLGFYTLDDIELEFIIQY